MKKLTKNDSAPIFQISLRWHSLANILLQGKKVNRNDLVFFYFLQLKNGFWQWGATLLKTKQI